MRLDARDAELLRAVRAGTVLRGCQRVKRRLQQLRRDGLIEYVRPAPGAAPRWMLTEEGEKA